MSSSLSDSEVTKLLQSGLDHYGKDDVDEAIEAWCEALRVDPGNELAIDYLESAGYTLDDAAQVATDSSKNDSSVVAQDVGSHTGEQRPSTGRASSVGEGRPNLAHLTAKSSKPGILPDASGEEDEAPSSSHVDAQGELRDPELRRLMVERRFEEALTLLYRLRAREPRDAAISRSIQLLRERLVEIYSDKLLNLDRVPLLSSAAEGYAFSSEERHIALLVDGISSFGDILGSSRLGRVTSLRILCEFQESDLLTSTSSCSASLRRPTDTTQTPSSESFSKVRRIPEMGAYRQVSTYRPSRSASAVSLSPTLTLAAEPSSQLEETAPSTPKIRLAPQQVESDGYEERFAEAMRHYLMRDFKKAISLFERCREERPGDARPGHNLKAILRRAVKS